MAIIVSARPDKVTTQLRVDGQLYEKIKYIARQELRSVNNQIEYFIKKGVEQYEAERGREIIPAEFLGDEDE